LLFLRSKDVPGRTPRKTMTNPTAILNHLQASSLLKVREWAKVLWVKAVVAGRVVCRFVSKKIGVEMKRIGLTGYELPEFAPSFSSPEEEYEWLCDWQQQKENQAVGDIAKLLPVGARPKSYNVDLAAAKVANGDMTLAEAVAFLSSKKPILRK